MAGYFDEPSSADRGKINHVTKWYKPWFYKHVETYLKKVRLTQHNNYCTVIA